MTMKMERMLSEMVRVKSAVDKLLLKEFLPEHSLIPEVNLGQLLMLIRAQFLIDAEGYDRVRGKPFTIAEIVTQADRLLSLAD